MKSLIRINHYLEMSICFLRLKISSLKLNNLSSRIATYRYLDLNNSFPVIVYLTLDLNAIEENISCLYQTNNLQYKGIKCLIQGNTFPNGETDFLAI